VVRSLFSLSELDVVETVSPMHKSNGSVNVSCSDLVTLNKQSDKTNRSSSENVLENVNQRTNKGG
jgi:hypothetical protein